MYRLSKDEMHELKKQYLTEECDKYGISPSYGELVDVDYTVSDEQVISQYGHINFVRDDFFCNVCA